MCWLICSPLAPPSGFSKKGLANMRCFCFWRSMVRSRGLVSSDVSRRQAFRLVRRPVSSDLSSRQASRLVRPLVASDAAVRPTPRLARWLFYSARLFVSNFLSATDSPSTRQNVSTQNRDMVQTTMLYFDGAPVLPHCWAPWSAAILARPHHIQDCTEHVFKRS